MANLMVTFLDCVEPFGWEYFPLFLLDDLLNWWISQDMCHLRCICRDVRNSTDIHAAPYLAKRKADQRAYIIQRFPTFVQDCEVFGAPWLVMPLPTWRVWRVQEWWYVVRGRSWPKTEWILVETHWLRNLIEMAQLETSVGGLFTFCRFDVRSYTWDYEWWWWVEEDHI